MKFTVGFFALAASFVAAQNGGLGSIAVTHNLNVPRHGPSEHYRTLKKFGLEIPERLQQIVDEHKNSIANKAEINATAKGGDLMWLSPVGIGTPPQQLFLDVDTGSTDTWVFSTDTNKKEVAGQALYDPSKSSTAIKVPNCTWSIIYGDFSTSEGGCYRDTFTVGDLSMANMTIESATSVSTMFTETSDMSGLVGLAWPSIKQTIPPQKCLLEFLPEVLNQSVFTVDFRHNSTGSYNFGFINDTLHQDDIQYVSVNTADGFWAVQNTGFALSNSDLAYSFATPKEVIVDTGSTLLFAPDSAVDTYFDQIPSANFSFRDYGYVIPCDEQLPDFLYEISDLAGNRITGAVPGAYLIYAKASGNSCYAGLQALGAFSGIQGIFGDIFLKSTFAVFDIAQKRLGIAPKPLNLSNS
ncbi:aspartic peptidase domain-containing protein [Xylariomycetidae sp. FL0641]|nr:aspartic peptidase domain-containing protein [Xylariomycetidae sp. FL0641]